MDNNRHTALLILDGWGIGTKPASDAIAMGKTPYMDYLMNTYPHASLTTFGSDVGLPAGQMGNSEVGHLNIGAGRIVYQELLRINNAIDDRSFFENKVLLEALQYAKVHNKPIHLLGLLSDGGVHSHLNHIKAICDLIALEPELKAYIHGFTDGRDVDPKSGIHHVTEISNHIKDKNTSLASIIGRYYAMDRDKRWDRIQKAYNLLVKGMGTETQDPLSVIQSNYDADITDEFIEPITIRSDDNRPTTIKNGDVVIFFNFRTDRPRQLTQVLNQEDFDDHDMQILDLHFVTMTSYSEDFDNVHIIFTKDNLTGTLGEVLAQNSLSQVRIAETEKYPHVTFFFNGGREDPFPGEDRILIPSPKVATYDLQPEMSAIPLTDAIINKIKNDHPHFICLNYANTDMVGHTGDFIAAQKAAETVDSCLKRLVPTLLDQDYDIIIIADHGNSDYMINENGSPNTAHTTNPVPIIYVSNQASSYTIKNGILADIAPTLLACLSISTSSEMTGKNLIEKI